MTISYSGKEAVTLKIKNDTVILGDTLSVAGYELPGAGEYDIAGIQCEVKNLTVGTVAFLRAEDLTITHLSQLDTGVTTLDDASNTDILIVRLTSENTAADLKPVLKAVEPTYLFITGSGLPASLATDLGLPLGESSTLKVTRSSLPLEGTTFIPAP